MNPILPALALTVFLIVGLRAIGMIRDRSALAGFDRQGAVVEASGERSRPLLRRFHAFADRLAPRMTRLLGPRRLDAIRDRLEQAGRPGRLTVERYAGRKAAFFVLAGSLGLFYVVGGRPFVGLFLMVAGWFWMDLWLARAAQGRRDAIERNLPDFLDILAVTVSAGVGFRSALERVAESLGGPLGEEVMTALHQMDMGATRREAFFGMRRRNGSESLTRFVTALLQAEELGVPLSDALANLAIDMRRDFYQQARRRAARTAPRVSLIVSLVVVPGSLILIIGALVLGGTGGLDRVFGG